MRLVSHPNVVELKAFFYSNGEKVSPILLSANRTSLISPPMPPEGRSLPQPRSGVRTRDRLPSFQALCQAQAGHANVAGQVVHVPGGFGVFKILVQLGN